MVYSYEECLEKYGSAYQISKQVKEGKLYKIEKGIYSDMPQAKDLEVISKKHSKAVFTLESAFYYHGISDTIPDDYNLATPRDTTKIKDARIKQYFIPADVFVLGTTEIEHNGVEVTVYNKERMLIELMRYRTKLPFEYYKQIIEYYRAHIYELDEQLLMEYCDKFPKAERIEEAIQLEVY